MRAGPMPTRFIASTWPYSCTNRPNRTAPATTQLPVRNHRKPAINRVETTAQTGCCPLSSRGVSGRALLRGVSRSGVRTGGGVDPSRAPQGPSTLIPLPSGEKVDGEAGRTRGTLATPSTSSMYQAAPSSEALRAPPSPPRGEGLRIGPSDQLHVDVMPRLDQVIARRLRRRRQ